MLVARTVVFAIHPSLHKLPPGLQLWYGLDNCLQPLNYFRLQLPTYGQSCFRNTGSLWAGTSQTGMHGPSMSTPISEHSEERGLTTCPSCLLAVPAPDGTAVLSDTIYCPELPQESTATVHITVQHTTKA